MMRLEVRLAFGHSRFPAADELALGDALHLGVLRKARPLIDRAGQGTDHGSVYSQFEFLRREYKKVRRVVLEVLRELSVEHLARITEQRPLASYKVVRPDHRRRTPMKNCLPPSYLQGKAR